MKVEEFGLSLENDSILQQSSFFVDIGVNVPIMAEPGYIITYPKEPQTNASSPFSSL